jgi:hypothetical protein
MKIVPNGLDIQLDFGLYDDIEETKKKAKTQSKKVDKKSSKPLGGKLFKMV